MRASYIPINSMGLPAGDFIATLEDVANFSWESHGFFLFGP